LNSNAGMSLMPSCSSTKPDCFRRPPKRRYVPNSSGWSAVTAEASWASSPGVRSRMQLQASKHTRPELALRRALHARGLRFRLHRQIVPGTRRTVDIVFGPARVAVDVRGCYWHGHAHEFEAYQRRRNIDYWQPKIAGNRKRDADTECRLTEAGWLVVVVW